jgi:hypothetical protein
MHPDPSQSSAHRSRRTWSRLTSIAAAGIVAAGALSLAAAPSNAVGIGGGTGTFAASNGIVGVPQTVIYTLTSGSIQDGSQVPITATGSAFPQTVTAATVTLFSGSQASFVWTPPHVGTWTFCATGFTCTGSAFVNQVGTSISVTAPNTVQVGVGTTVSATVSAQSGSVLSPLGSVQFAIVGRGNQGAPVWLNGGSPSTASLPWTPTVLGPVTWTATYTPWSVNGNADTTCGASCTSAPDTVQVTASGASFFLSNPGALTAGATAQLQAVVGVVPPTGSVTFFINGGVIAANVPVTAQGLAVTNWTPPAPGQYTLSANWIANNGVQGTANEVLNVVAGPVAADGIVVTQVGVGVWSPAGVYTLQNGTSATFTTASSSGAPVTLTDSGPCTMSGNSLVVSQGNGSCRLIASSPGGNGYAANTLSFQVNLAPGTQTATIAAPVSGRVNVGRTLRLESPNQADTNAGQNITWRITEGRNTVCSLRFPSSGAVNLRINRRGQCNVVGSAPAVPGQWNAFRVTRSYRGV